jgi:hypothetical protein
MNFFAHPVACLVIPAQAGIQVFPFNFPGFRVALPRTVIRGCPE